MFPFSTDLLASCIKFVELAKASSNEQEIRIFNASCVINAVSLLEAKLNEEISIARILFDESELDGRVWKVIEDIQKKLSIQEKWNLIAIKTNGLLWDSACDPFQSFEVMISLRNELVHYKGAFLGENEAPNKKIINLMEQLGVESKSTWIEADCSSWIFDLLNTKELSEWLSKKINNFNKIYYELMYDSACKPNKQFDED
jgi:hypothetical protein